MVTERENNANELANLAERVKELEAQVGHWSTFLVTTRSICGLARL